VSIGGRGRRSLEAAGLRHHASFDLSIGRHVARYSVLGGRGIALFAFTDDAEEHDHKLGSVLPLFARVITVRPVTNP
jgi:hypothetical protein